MMHYFQVYHLLQQNMQFYQQFKAMIIAYCLSVYAINFFNLPTLQKFKLRLINQQTADCADSPILNAQKIQPTDFPVVINLKGSDRLLMKVKMLAFQTKQAQKLIGEGVVNFTKNDINNSLRVPIYDKKQGVEEVALCSIDFFVSGFLYEKNKNINADKSRSRVQDWRQRSDEAVYSQMSYTLVSQQQQEQNEKSEKGNPKVSHNQKNTQNLKTIFPIRLSKADENQQLKQPLKQRQDYKSLKVQKPNLLQQQLQQVIPVSEPHQIGGEQVQNSLPLQNTVYLGNSNNQQLSQDAIQNIHLLSIKSKEEDNQQPIIATQRKQQQIALKSIEMPASPESENSKIYSPEKLKRQIKESQKLMTQLKQYLSDRRRQDQVKSTVTQQQKVNHQKVRRKNVKIQQISAYKFQNNFIEYHITAQASKSPKIIKNLRAVKIINNEIKQSKDEIIIDVPINKVQFYLMNGKKIVSLDAMGYRYFCVTNHFQQNAIEIKIPPEETGIRACVIFKDEGEFQGTIGLQQGEQMAIYLNRKEANVGPILNKQEFKLYFDIKQQFSIKPIKTTLEINDNQVSFRQPYELINDNDLRKRVTSMSLQPWGYAKSYSEQAKVSQQALQMLDRMNDRFRGLKKEDEIEDKSLQSQRRHTNIDKTQNKMIFLKGNSHKNQESKFDNSEYSFLMKKFCTSESPSQNQSVIQRKKIKQSIKNSPIRKKTRKKPQNLSESQISEANDIMNIRNGNRSNYKFKNKAQQSQIKQLWQKLLIKKKMQEQKADKKRANKSRRSIDSILSTKGKKSLDILNESSFMKESDLPSERSKLSSRINQYQFKKGNDSSSSNSEINQQTKLFPLRSLTLEIKNISITEPQIVINQDHQDAVGKFVKITIKNKVQYFTEVIFNGEYNSILWKLEGCIFTELTGSEKIQLEIYQAHDNQITVLGKSFIRISKLHFLKNNHIYNGKIIYNNMLNGEYTLGFNIVELYPFQIIQEEDEQTTIRHLPKVYSPSLNKSRRNGSQERQRIIQNNLAPKRISRISRSLDKQDLKKIKIINNSQNRQLHERSNFRNEEESLGITRRKQKQ